MNWVDIALVLVVLFSVINGYRKGFILSAIDLCKWVGSLLVAFLFYPYIVNLLEKWIPSLDIWKLPLAFLITFLLVFTIISVVMNAVLKNTSVNMQESFANKFFGVLPGFVSGLISASVIALLLLSFALSDSVTRETRNSALTARLAPPAEWLEEKLRPVFDDAINHGLAKLTIKPGSEKTVDLPYNVRGKARADLEAEMLVLVNNERVKNGLKPLQADPELVPVARAHSSDMFMRGYFSHNNPEGQTPFDRMKKANVYFAAAGENLALAPTLQMAHDGLMNSPGHRANILSRSFGRLGIGIIDGGRYGLMVSQEFRN